MRKGSPSVSLVVVMPAAAKAAGLKLEDVELFEINKTFASYLIYRRKKLEIVPQKINVSEDAMAIGHSLGTLRV